MVITATPIINWDNNCISTKEKIIMESSSQHPLDICNELYRSLNINYPKFFKMDILSKVALIITEVLLQQNNFQHLNTNNTAVVLATTNGCITVDQQFNESISSIPSPALFVYTLPNIMLGEICIKHGFKGEQMCFIQDEPDQAFLNTYAEDLLMNRNSSAVLTGYINATSTKIAAQIWLLSK